MEAAVEGEAGSKIFMAMGKCTMEGIEEVFKRVESDLVESAKGIIRSVISLLKLRAKTKLIIFTVRPSTTTTGE